MTAKSRYWDYQRCAWVACEASAAPATAPPPPAEAITDALPEQRSDQSADASTTR